MDATTRADRYASQARMLAAAATLAERGYRAGLRPLNWRVDPAPPLIGRVSGYDLTAEEARATLAGCAEPVGAPVRATRTGRDGAVRLGAAGTAAHPRTPVPVALVAYTPEDWAWPPACTPHRQGELRTSSGPRPVVDGGRLRHGHKSDRTIPTCVGCSPSK